MYENEDYYLVKPFDVLYFRDNRAFDIGEWYSEGIFPPLPSTFQGFVRTSILAHKKKIAPNGQLTDVQDAKKIVGDDKELTIQIDGPFLYFNDSFYLQTPKDIVNENGAYIQINLSNKPISGGPDYALHYALNNVKTPYLYWENHFLNQHAFNFYRQNGWIDNQLLEDNAQPVFIEEHTGIKLDYSIKSNKEGSFFVTPFNRLNKEAAFCFSIKHNIDNLDLNRQHGKLGSEARGVVIENSLAKLDILKLNTNFFGQLAQNKKFKLILLTPGIFKEGWLPFEVHENKNEIFLTTREGLQLKLFYAAMDAPLKISGYSQRSQQKHGYKDTGRGKAVKEQVQAVSAGSVYYLEIINDKLSQDEIIKLLENLDFTTLENKPYSDMGYNKICIGKI